MIFVLKDFKKLYHIFDFAIISPEKSFKETLLVLFFVAQICNFAEAFTPNIRKIVPFYDLPILAFGNNEKKIEAAFLTINDTDLVVAPLVVCIFVHWVTLLVQNINNLNTAQTSLDEEWELNRIVCR